MDFLVLGPLQVRSDEGTTVPVDAAKQRAVLGVLVANVDRVVSVDRLLEDVWGDELPKGGTKTLRYHISKLRDTLQPGRLPGDQGAVATVAGGYDLRLDQTSSTCGDSSRWPTGVGLPWRRDVSISLGSGWPRRSTSGAEVPFRTSPTTTSPRPRSPVSRSSAWCVSKTGSRPISRARDTGRCSRSCRASSRSSPSGSDSGAS